MKARINRLLKPFGVALTDLDERAYWPRGKSRLIGQPFLFLIAPPSSGATEIAAYIARRGDIGGLHPSFEGQRLIRGLMDTDRWWPEKFVDFEAVIGAWSRRMDEMDPHGRYAYWLEKSPPNLVRHAQLLKHFPDHRVLVSNRAPIASIASQVRRYLVRDYHGARRSLVVRHLAKIWAWRSGILMKAVQDQGYPCVTYEQFRQKPDRVMAALGLDSAQEALPRPVAHRHEVPSLSEQECELVAEELASAGQVLEFFGYDTGFTDE